MAKHCTICNQDYAEELSACPHCASAHTTHQAGRGEDRATQLAPRGEERTTQLGGPLGAETGAAPTPFDSAIDFGASPSSKPATGDASEVGPLSGGSTVAWASLVEEPAAEPGKDVRIDAPSDADILVHEQTAAPSGTPADVEEELVGELLAEEPVFEVTEADAAEEMVDLSAAPTPSGAPPSSSAVDLGAAPVEIIEDESGAVIRDKPEGESQVFMAELASDASHVDLVGDSSVHLSGDEVMDVVEEVVDAPADEGAVAAELTEEAALDALMADPQSSAVDLGGRPSKSDASLSAEEVGAVARVPDGSGIDLEGLHVPDGSGSFPPGSESSVDLGSHAEIAPLTPSEQGIGAPAGSGIDVEEPAPISAGSGIDLDAPGSVSAGSGIDLGVPGERATSDSASGRALEELLSDSPHEEPVSVEEAASEEAALAAVEETPVSEEEVNDLLAGLEESPVPTEPGMTPEEAAEIAEGEQAIADAEAEEAAETAAAEEAVEDGAEAEAEVEEKPVKPARPRSNVPALVGGTLVGLLLGAGGLIGARFVGVDVPAMIGAGEKEKKSAQVNTQSPLQPKAAPTFDAFESLLRNGEWAEAEKAGIEKYQAAKASELVARGEYHLGNYLKNVGSIKNPQDPALQPALQDLQKAAEMDDVAAADAIYDLAFIKELAGQLPQARDEYARGAQKFQNQPEQKQRFESAMERVEWKASIKGGSAQLPLPAAAEERAMILALLLIGMQEPPAQQPQPQAQPGQQPQAPPGQQPQAQPAQQPAPAGQQPQGQAALPEAGYEFWRAARLARSGQYADAIRSLDQARKLHNQRRFSRLRKAQNPLSDPAEDIFLRCCDELRTYWQMENRLHDGGYLTEKNTPAEALQAVLQKADASAALSKDLTEKLVAAKVIGKDEDVTKGLDSLIAAKKKAEDTAADLMTKLKTATDENTKLDNDLTTAKQTIKDRDAALMMTKEAAKKLEAAHGELDATMKKAVEEMTKAGILDPRSKPNISEAVKKLVDVAKTMDPQGTIRQQRGEIAQLSAALKETRQPEEMLPLWLLLLDENRERQELVLQATKDVERVKKDPRATAAQKGEAEIVLGLALRNAGQFSQARPVLEAARKAVDKGEWLARADAALQEVSRPAAYFNRQAQALYDHGNMVAALALLDRAMKVVPENEQGQLLAQRSLMELDAAQAKTRGTLTANEALVVAARNDANQAVKAGAAEGHYAAGRIAEALGQVDTAINSYRAALKAHGDKLDADGSRYRMALARVLLLPREARPAQRVGWSDPAPYPARHYEAMQSMVLMLTLGLQAPLLPGEEPGSEEAERLADEVLRAAAQRPGTVPFNVLAQALAVKGRWNEAWQTYLAGIQPMLPREYGTGLVYLLDNDPRLRRPASLRTPNPLEAEKHFAAGLNFYFDRDYANAEKEFRLTIENNSQDARFFYFLGLSRLAQNRRRDAAADFDEAARLERLNRPAPAAVSESLERIQGPMRQTLNEIRFRPEPLPERR